VVELAVSRGRIWVDKSLLRFPQELQLRNVCVDIVPTEMKISEVKQLVADQRFVTARTQDSIKTSMRTSIAGSMLTSFVAFRRTNSPILFLMPGLH
jgi:hypothetical protein